LKENELYVVKKQTQQQQKKNNKLKYNRIPEMTHLLVCLNLCLCNVTQFWTAYSNQSFDSEL